MPFNIGPLELIVVLVIALLVLGPGKLPEVGSALGKSIREFRKAATDVQDAARIDAPPPPAAGAAPTATPLPTSPTAANEAHTVGASPSTVPSPAPNTLSNQTTPNEISTEPKG